MDDSDRALQKANIKKIKLIMYACLVAAAGYYIDNHNLAIKLVLIYLGINAAWAIGDIEYIKNRIDQIEEKINHNK